MTGSSGSLAVDLKRGENHDHPLRKNGTARLRGDGTPTALERSRSIDLQETYWRPPNWTCFGVFLLEENSGITTGLRI